MSTKKGLYSKGLYNPRFDQINHLATILGKPVSLIEREFTEWLKKSPSSFQTAIDYCSSLARIGKPMPWEINENGNQ